MPKFLLAALIGAGALSYQTMFGSKAAAGTAADHGPTPAPEKDLAPPTEAEKVRTAIFAGGCFWCTEGVFEQLKGVTDVTSGYDGDSKKNATYEAVCSHGTLHAEAIKITYDPKVTTYGRLLRVFFALHDPTTLDRQGPDAGHQYRSAVFYENDEQKAVAEAYIAQLTKAKYYDSPIVTTVEPVGLGFFPAEAYHQNYVEGNMTQPYVCSVALPKIDKVRKLFPEELKKKP